MEDIYSWGDWFRCSKDIVRDKTLSQSAKWLYVVLSELNNCYSGKQGFFTRSNKDLMNDCGMSDKTLKKAKKDLIEKGYIKVWHNNLWGDDEQKTQTTYSICYYKLLK